MGGRCIMRREWIAENVGHAEAGFEVAFSDFRHAPWLYGQGRAGEETSVRSWKEAEVAFLLKTRQKCLMSTASHFKSSAVRACHESHACGHGLG